MPRFDAPDVIPGDADRKEQDRFDETVDASFPASDPPGWTPVVRIGRPASPARQDMEAGPERECHAHRFPRAPR